MLEKIMIVTLFIGIVFILSFLYCVLKISSKCSEMEKIYEGKNNKTNKK